MPWLAWAGVAVLGFFGLWTVGEAAESAGEGVDKAGSGALKLAGASAVALGVFMVGRKKKLW